MTSPQATDRSEWIVNPFLTVDWEGPVLVLSSPVPGQRLRQLRATERETPALFRVLAEVAPRLVPGQDAMTLPDDLRQLLCARGVLVTRARAPKTVAFSAPRRCAREGSPLARRTRAWIAAARASHVHHGYAELSGVLAPSWRRALAQYYRQLVAQGHLPFQDGQSRRFWRHNDPAARLIHAPLAGLVSQVVGEPVKASYVYLGIYVPGAELERHVDREQCEITVSMLVDFSPGARAGSGWPLLASLTSGERAFYQEPGDALLFRGRRIPHARPPLPAPHVSTSLFFHYVLESFSGSLE